MDETTTTPDPNQDLIDQILGDKPTEPVKQMVVRESETIGVKVSELRAIANKNPNHAKAQVFADATRSHRPTDVVYVEKIDLEAIIRDRNVTTVVTNEKTIDANGIESVVPVERKHLDPQVAIFPKETTARMP